MKIISLFKEQTLKLVNSHFAKNASILLIVTVFSQIVSIISLPVITSLFSKIEIGLINVYTSFFGLLGVFSTLGYSNAIILSKDEKEENELIILCLINMLLIAFFFALIMVFLRNHISQYLQLSNNLYLLGVPFTVLYSGLNNLIIGIAMKHSKFSFISKYRITLSLLTPLGAISLGLMNTNFYVLYLCYVVFPFIVAFGYFSFLLFKSHKNFRTISLCDLKFQYKQHSNFLKFTLFSDFINTSINQIPVYFILKISGLGAVAQYNLTNRILGLPVTIISSSIGEVFKQQASKEFLNNNNCIKTFRFTTFWLITLSIPFFLILFLSAPYIIDTFFGKDWSDVSFYLRILCFLYMLRFIVSPLTFVFNLTSKQKQDFYGHLFMLLIPFISYSFSSLLNFENQIITFLLFFTLLYSTLYCFYFYKSYKYASNK